MMLLHRPILTATLNIENYPAVWTLRLPNGRIRRVTGDRWQFASRPYPRRFRPDYRSWAEVKAKRHLPI